MEKTEKIEKTGGKQKRQEKNRGKTEKTGKKQKERKTKNRLREGEER